MSAMKKLSIFNYSIANQGNGVLDVYVDGDIVDASTQEIYREWLGDETSTSYKSFRDQVQQANPSTLNVHVNSPGGHVGDAMAIHDYMQSLEDKGVTINRYGTGIVASAATYIVMGKNSSLSKNCWFMIHNCSGYAWGSVNEVEQTAALLRKFNDRVVSFYSEMTGLSTENIGKMMDKETWMTADDAKNLKFIETVGKSENVVNTIPKEKWLFNNMAVLNTYNSTVIQNTNDMKFDIKKITDSVLNSVKKALNIGAENELKPSELKAEELQNAISLSVTNALVSLEETIQSGIDNAATEALKSDGFKQAIENGIAEALKGDSIKNAVSENLKNILESFTNSITEATKNFASNEDLEKLKNELEEVKEDIQNNSDGAKPKVKKTENSAGKYEHEGINW